MRSGPVLYQIAGPMLTLSCYTLQIIPYHDHCDLRSKNPRPLLCRLAVRYASVLASKQIPRVYCYKGNIAALSMISVPAINNVKAGGGIDSSQAARLWEQNYSLGKSQNPPVALIGAGAFTFLAWSFRHKMPIRGVKPTYMFAAAAMCTLGIVPYTLTFMGSTNGRLLDHAAAAKHLDMSAAAGVDVDQLLAQWKQLNSIRSVLPLIGTIIAGFAVIA